MEELNLTKEEVDLFISIARAFPDKMDFLQEYDKYVMYDGDIFSEKSYEEFLQVVLNVRMAEHDVRNGLWLKRWTDIRRKMDTVKEVAQYSRHPGTRELASNLLSKIGRWANENITIRAPYDESEYFAYQSCCSCGAEPEGDGHRVITLSNGIKYPQCESCLGNQSAPEWERVAKIYFVISAELNLAIEALQEQI